MVQAKVTTSHLALVGVFALVGLDLDLVIAVTSANIHQGALGERIGVTRFEAIVVGLRFGVGIRRLTISVTVNSYAIIRLGVLIIQAATNVPPATGTLVPKCKP